MNGTDRFPGHSQEDGYFRILFDTVPSPVLIVDEDVRILEYNRAAAEILGPDRSVRYMKRGGEALGCLHSGDSPEGCGRGESCKECVIRNSVSQAMNAGEVRRRRTVMWLGNDPKASPAEVMLLVTAAPFQYEGKRLVLLFLEDVSELMQLQKILPICSHCRKIRNEDNYWKSVEEYFLDHENMVFSHSICNSCLEEHYKLDPSRKR